MSATIASCVGRRSNVLEFSERLNRQRQLPAFIRVDGTHNIYQPRCCIVVIQVVHRYVWTEIGREIILIILFHTFSSFTGDITTIRRRHFMIGVKSNAHPIPQCLSL
jgi:hypothetical protein